MVGLPPSGHLLRQSEPGARAQLLSLNPGAPRTSCLTASSTVHDKYFFTPFRPKLRFCLSSSSPHSFHFLSVRPAVSQPIAKLPHASSDMQRRATAFGDRSNLVDATYSVPLLSMYDPPPAVTNNRSFRNVQDPPNYLQNPLDGWSRICFSTAKGRALLSQRGGCLDGPRTRSVV